MQPPQPRLPANAAFYLLAFALCASIPASYIYLTDHIWEDYFITFRHSRNLAQGNGLVYNPGERVHGFTSPVGTLLPALFDWLLDSDSYRPALRCFQCVSIAAFAGGAVLILSALSQAGAPLLARVTFLALYALDAKSVAFSANGMETGFVLLFLAWTLYCVAVGVEDHFVSCGLAWAGLMWTRPDGCLLIAPAAFGALWLAHDRRQTLRAIRKAGLVCLGAYLPWLAAVWVYYGSPIPQTIIAKAGGYNRRQGPTHWTSLIPVNSRLLEYPKRAAFAFQPIYANESEGWPWLVRIGSLPLALFASLRWLWTGPDRLGRPASLVFTFMSCYLIVQPITFPWYYPPITVCGWVVIAGALGVVSRKRVSGRLIALCLAITVIIFTAWQLAITTRMMAAQQRVIEANRRAIGEWLAEHAKPGDTVYTESFGYIGFFSNCRIEDFPGLVSPRVTRLRYSRGLSFVRLIPELKPEWIVARPMELDLIKQLPPRLFPYEVAAEFNVRADLEPLGAMHGIEVLRFDSVFVILRRITQSPAAPSGG